jgi:hypothetical protein
VDAQVGAHRTRAVRLVAHEDTGATTPPTATGAANGAAIHERVEGDGLVPLHGVTSKVSGSPPPSRTAWLALTELRALRTTLLVSGTPQSMLRLDVFSVSACVIIVINFPMLGRILGSARVKSLYLGHV